MSWYVLLGILLALLLVLPGIVLAIWLERMRSRRQDRSSLSLGHSP